MPSGSWRSVLTPDGNFLNHFPATSLMLLENLPIIPPAFKLEKQKVCPRNHSIFASTEGFGQLWKRLMNGGLFGRGPLTFKLLAGEFAACHLGFKKISAKEIKNPRRDIYRKKNIKK